MAKIKVKPKKSIIEAENPITLWTTAKEYVVQNARQIGAIVLVIAVIAGGAFAWSMMRARTERESLNMFHGAMATLAAAVDSKTGAAKPAVYATALTQFKEVKEKYGTTQTGRLALLYAGNSAYNLKKYDEAIGYYTEFLDAAHGNLQYLRATAMEGLGYACEGKGDFKAAAEWFEKQKKETDGTGGAVLNLARVLELGGDRQKACQQYKEFIEKNPLSEQKQFAQIKAESICPKKGS